eukprot:GHVR01046464.1.p1 GENE.GHVR01046464.1~~GHVR01046464.1.p1  ORF type:complete len:130 (-),score=19.49 GHVR01046464.1:201-590(-)
MPPKVRKSLNQKKHHDYIKKNYTAAIGYHDVTGNWWANISDSASDHEQDVLQMKSFILYPTGGEMNDPSPEDAGVFDASGCGQCSTTATVHVHKEFDTERTLMHHSPVIQVPGCSTDDLSELLCCLKKF